MTVALISEIVTVFVTHICIFVFFPIRYSPVLNAQINKITKAKKKKKKGNLMYFGNAKVIHELIHVELAYFCTFDAVDAISNICSTY